MVPPDAKNKEDYRADGHPWVNNGTARLPRSNPVIVKMYFYIRIDGKPNKSFTKTVFYLPEHDFIDARKLIHYMGDEGRSLPGPHGNSKQPKIFFRTPASKMTEIEESVAGPTQPHKAYKEDVSEGKSIPDTGRNLKQYQNAKAKMNSQVRSTRDVITNAHEIAYLNPGYVRYITTYPDLCIIIGTPHMTETLVDTLKINSKDQLLSYDTTFQLGEFYVSPVLFRNVAFEGSPVMMLGAMLHEGKHELFHKQLFRYLFQGINVKDIPIATDEETALVNAIEEETDMIRLGCYRHLRGDIQRWVDDNAGTKDDRQAYTEEVQTLLSCETKEEFHTLLEKRMKKWSEPFVQYFQKNILKKVDAYGIWNVSKYLDIRDKDILPVTTNQSEGFNTLLKSLQDWKEVPLDVIMLSMQMLQKYYYHETKRGKVGVGNFNLKFEDLRESVDTLVDDVIVTPENIVLSIQGKDFMMADIEVPVYSCVKTTVAKEIIARDAISFSPRLGVFTVINNDLAVIVKMTPEPHCTCPCRTMCPHILAVALSIGLEIDEEAMTLKKRNLGQLRKNAKDNKVKSGRKRPKKDTDLEAAPDSEEAKKKSKKSKKREETHIDINSDDEELNKDIRYSREVWITGNDIFHSNMNTQERELVMGETDDGWISDLIIDYSQTYMKYLNKDIYGLEDVVNVGLMNIERLPYLRPCIQIINTDVEGKGNHWICLSTVNCDPATIEVFDSGGTTHLRYPCIKAICHLLPRDMTVDTLKLKMVPVQLQTNGNDCGVFAIANALSLVHGVHPSEVDYNISEMRDHLKNSIENRDFSELFPHVPNTTRDSNNCVTKTERIKCICRMPDDGLYFECTQCGKDFHSQCVGIVYKTKVQLERMKVARCLVCQSNPLKKKKSRRPLGSTSCMAL